METLETLLRKMYRDGIKRLVLYMLCSEDETCIGLAPDNGGKGFVIHACVLDDEVKIANVIEVEGINSEAAEILKSTGCETKCKKLRQFRVERLEN